MTRRTPPKSSKSPKFKPKSAPAPYAALYCKSHFSFLEGASSPTALVERAAELGLGALALTDRDGVYGVVRAHIRAKALGLKLLIGSELTLDDGSTLLLYATDRPSYARLCQLITVGRLRCPKGESRVTWDEVIAHAPDLLALWGGAQALIAQPGAAADAQISALSGPLAEAFGDRLYALVTDHRDAKDPSRNARIRARAAALNCPVLHGTRVLYATTEDRDLCDIVTCIRHGVTVHTAGRLIPPNAEHALLSPAQFATRSYADPDAAARTMAFAQRCQFSMDDLRYRYPSETLDDGRTSQQRLHDMTFEGAQKRYPSGVPSSVITQLEKELRVIDELDYPGYFLTMAEIVIWARSQKILCQGRGSAANSAVCFCLGITSVDPTRVTLLFERFISVERAEPPDIDLDIAHARREEVIQFVYRTYGRTHAAMVANLIRYRPRSAIRDVGKALGLPIPTLERISKLMSHAGAPTEEHLRNAGMDPDPPLHQHLLRLATALLEAPRHLSIHPGGFLLGHEPVADLVPIENATMADRTVVQWDKYDVEAMGLFKVDLLGLGALTQLDLCFRLLEETRDIHASMATLPAGDIATYDMLCRAETVGIFQIESRAQMSMLPRLRPREYYDLVIQISIVRPGPITGGMVHPYLRRRNGEEPVTYPHPLLEPVLKKTLGVPLFQEQVMRLSIIAADYTPGEADQLRRDMGAWRSEGRIEAHRERLITRMVQKGIEPDFAARVFEQIRGFGEYGFPESHAASFALISYAASFLKCHYPAEFFCTLLNAQPLGFYSPATLLGEARRVGVRLFPVDIARSHWDCTLVPRPDGGHAKPANLMDNGAHPAVARPDADSQDDGRFALRVGLRLVRGLNKETAQAILTARRARPFISLNDVMKRVQISMNALKSLAESGAFGSLGVTRRQALWAVQGRDALCATLLPLDTEGPAPELPALNTMERIRWDYRSSDHSPEGHPLTPLRNQLQRLGFPTASDLRNAVNGQWVRYAGLIICRQRPQTAKGVVFMTLEDETGFVNTIVWPDISEQFQTLIKSAVFLAFEGRLQREYDVAHLIVRNIWQPQLDQAPPAPRSRDFH